MRELPPGVSERSRRRRRVEDRLRGRLAYIPIGLDGLLSLLHFPLALPAPTRRGHRPASRLLPPSSPLDPASSQPVCHPLRSIN